MVGPARVQRIAQRSGDASAEDASLQASPSIRAVLPSGARFCVGERRSIGLTLLATVVGLRLDRIMLHLGLGTWIAAVSKIN